MKEIGFARRGQKGLLFFTSLGKWDEKSSLASNIFYDMARSHKNYQNAFPEQIIIKDGNDFTAYKRISKGGTINVQQVGKFKGIENRFHRGEIILVRAKEKH